MLDLGSEPRPVVETATGHGAPGLVVAAVVEEQDEGKCLRSNWCRTGRLGRRLEDASAAGVVAEGGDVHAREGVLRAASCAAVGSGEITTARLSDTATTAVRRTENQRMMPLP
jgi:hypothetical protein